MVASSCSINLLNNISTQIRQSLETEKIFQTAAQEIGKAFNVNQALIFTCSQDIDETTKKPSKIICVAEYINANYSSFFCALSLRSALISI